MENLNSEKFPNITYDPGEEIWIDPHQNGNTFYFDVSEDLTSDRAAMSNVALFLDDLDNLKRKAITYLKSTLADEQSEEYELIHYFLEFHKEETDPETLNEMLGIDEANSLTLEDFIDYLSVKRFGSLTDESLNEQVFIMDLSFHPDYTDELMVVYFNTDKEILLITHES